MRPFLALFALASIFLGAPGRAGAEFIFALTTDNGLLSFDSSSPGATTFVGTIAGLRPDESFVGIDFRPATGALYGLSLVPVGPTFFGQLYTIDTRTAAATPVGGPLTGVLFGSAFGIDFDPVADQLRVVSNSGLNLRISPTGQLVSVDGHLAYAPGDPHFGANPSVVGLAYTARATATVLYGIDSGLDVLVVLDLPNDGTLRTVGSLGFNISDLLGFDISADTGIAYAALTPKIGTSFSGLYTIDLDTGAATFVGDIDAGGRLVRGLAVAPVAAIPEPPAFTLFGVGALGLLGYGWWRRKRVTSTRSI
jgi:hypothetical protein